MPINRILAVRTDRFGEFLLNIPAFRALKQSYPNAKLTLAVNPYVEELARCVDYADEVITWENRPHTFGELIRFSNELKTKKFDICVIMNPSRDFNVIGFLAGIPVRVGYDHKWPILLTRKMKDEKYLGLKHEVEYNLDLVRLAGAYTEDKTLSLNIDSTIVNEISEYLGDFKNLIALHPFTGDSTKQWPLHNFMQLSKRLIQELQIKLVLIGGKEELSKNTIIFSGLDGNLVDMVGKTSLVQLAALLKVCRLLISGDSGPVHLASCVGTPALAIFRSDMPGKNSERWGPRKEGSIVIEKTKLTDITVDEVLNKIKLAWGGE
jgi:heptosyltransferase-2